jgi:hypothetical protein
MSIYVFHVPNAYSTFTRASSRSCFSCPHDFLTAPALYVKLCYRSCFRFHPKAAFIMLYSQISPLASSLTTLGRLHSIPYAIYLSLPIPVAISNFYLTFTCVVIAELQHGPTACLPYTNRAVAPTTHFSNPLISYLASSLLQSLYRPHSSTT